MLQWTKILFLLADSLIWNLVPLSTYILTFHPVEYLNTDNFLSLKKGKGRGNLVVWGFFEGLSCTTQLAELPHFG